MNQNQKIATIEPNKLFSELRGMMSKSYNFRGETLKINDVFETAQGFSVLLDTGKTIGLKVEKTAHFINECEFVLVLPQQAPSESITEVATIQPPSKDIVMFEDMTLSLYDQFNMLKSNPSKEVIDQTTTMVNVAGAISNLKKIQLQALKLSRK
jgi:hypothetical protein